jgi:hypothetical protein
MTEGRARLTDSSGEQRLRVQTVLCNVDVLSISENAVGCLKNDQF